VTGEKRAIIKAGRVNTNLTRNAAFFTYGKAKVIWGKAGEMVIMDMMVRLLTRSRVNFNFHFLFFTDVAGVLVNFIPYSNYSFNLGVAKVVINYLDD
jgi:hypothetical protein